MSASGYNPGESQSHTEEEKVSNSISVGAAQAKQRVQRRSRNFSLILARHTPAERQAGDHLQKVERKKLLCGELSALAGLALPR